MNPKVNWQALSEALKSEVQRISTELKKFDYQSVLTPAAAEKVKAFEKKYNVVLKQLHKVQRQADREFNRLLRQVKSQRSSVLGIVNDQRSRLEKAGKDLRNRFAKQAASETKTVKKKVRRRTKKV